MPDDDPGTTLACVSDVHANLPALEACLDHARDRDVDGVLFAGDLVGKGPQPGSVVDRFVDLDGPAIRGNVDRVVLEADSDPDDGGPAWTAAQLSPDQRDVLEDLPATWRGEVAGRDVLMVHGSPLGDTDFVFPSLTGRALESKLDGADPDVLVCGHTHLPFQRTIDGVHVVNCGSAGLPYDGDPRPSYVTLTLGPEAVAASVHRFEYDVERVVEAVEEADAPLAPAATYRTGRVVGLEDPGAGG